VIGVTPIKSGPVPLIKILYTGNSASSQPGDAHAAGAIAPKSVFLFGTFSLVRTFAPDNFEKIAAKVGKSALWCWSHDEGGTSPSKWIRPITSRLHGLKFFSGKNFGIESLWAGFFSARNLKKEK